MFILNVFSRKLDNNHLYLFDPSCSPCEDDGLEIFTAEFSDCSIKCCIPQQTLATTSLGSSSAAILQFKTYYWWPGAPGLGWAHHHYLNKPDEICANVQINGTQNCQINLSPPLPCLGVC